MAMIEQKDYRTDYPGNVWTLNQKRSPRLAIQTRRGAQIIIDKSTRDLGHTQKIYKWKASGSGRC